MKNFFGRYPYAISLILIFAIGECIVVPLGNFPLNDDWCYAKSVQILQNEGRIDIGAWPAMSLFSHIVWGFLFVKVFGFSFLVLRISTLVSAVISLLVFYKLILRISKDKVIAFISCLTLLFNPVYFNMCNTYMTDVNFLTLLILCTYFAFDFFESNKLSSFFLVFLFSTMLILLRQYGIIVPAVMTFASFFVKTKKTFFVILAICLSAAVFGIFHLYENYLRTILPTESSYEYSGDNNPIRRVFWEKLYYGITTRYKIVTIHAMFYTFPLVVVYFIESLKGQKWLAIFFIVAPVSILIYYLYLDYPLQVGNVFMNAMVGADTFYETHKGTFVNFQHNYSANFIAIITPLKYLFISMSLICTIFFLKKVKLKRTNPFKGKPEIIFLLTLFCSYVVVILITDSFFDRYQLPVITLSLVFFSYLNKVFRPRYLYAVLPLLCWFYVAVFGTKDYFTVNERKWEAYYYLRKEEKVEHARINGGFEISCWDNGKDSRWHDFLDLDAYDYLIQFKSEENFELIREYPFQKYFPYMKDTLRIFKKKIVLK